MRGPNVILDTNIVVSILKGSTRLSPLYRAFQEDAITLVICSELLKELGAVLARPRLEIAAKDVKELFRLIKAKAVRVRLPGPFIDACRDPEDNFLLELAVIAKAEYIITHDKDLLALNPFQGVAIMTAQEFMPRLKSGEER